LAAYGGIPAMLAMWGFIPTDTVVMVVTLAVSVFLVSVQPLAKNQ
jgi:hypothetical protein